MEICSVQIYLIQHRAGDNVSTNVDCYIGVDNGNGLIFTIIQKLYSKERDVKDSRMLLWIFGLIIKLK